MNASQLAQLLTLLPPSTQLLVHLIGAAATARLTQQLGGRTWTFTAGKNPAGQLKYAQLAEMVGEREASLLARHFGVGSDLYIPTCDKAMLAVRDANIVADFDRLTCGEGYTERAAVDELAGKYKLSDRWVRNVLKQPVRVVAANALQMDLFG